MCENCTNEDNDSKDQHSICEDERSTQGQPKESGQKPYQSYRHMYYSSGKGQKAVAQPQSAQIEVTESSQPPTTRLVRRRSLPLVTSSASPSLDELNSQAKRRKSIIPPALKNSKSTTDLPAINFGLGGDRMTEAVGARSSHLQEDQEHHEKMKHAKEILEKNNIKYNKSLFSYWESYYMNGW